MKGLGVKADKIRAGLYRLEGLRCHCGGELRIERCKEDGTEIGRGQWRWETFCVSCKDCDPDGWPTLAESVLEAPGFWQELAP